MPRGIVTALHSCVKQHAAVRLGPHTNGSFASQSNQCRSAEKIPQLRYRLICCGNKALHERNPDILRPDRSDQLTQARVGAITPNSDIGQGSSAASET